MDQSPNLRLPYLMPAQAQKHVTHNEALRALDAIVQAGVIDRDLTSPPASPAEGARYIVAAGATGDWTGKSGQIAAWQDGAWAFHEPRSGWLAWVADEARLVAFTGSTWVVAGGSAINPSLVGVNATADTGNRLAVSSPATLLNHEGGGHQLKVNKAASTNTASLLFQTAFSGRAEMGLAGDDDFRIKVSPDGVTWFEALMVARANGHSTMPVIISKGTSAAVWFSRRDNTSLLDGLYSVAGYQRNWSATHGDLLQLANDRSGQFIVDAAGGSRQIHHDSNCGRVSAWVQFNGTTGAIAGSFGVNAVTRNSTGKYTITWANALSGTGYGLVATLRRAANSGAAARVESQSSSACTVWCYDGVTASFVDGDAISVVALGV